MILEEEDNAAQRGFLAEGAGARNFSFVKLRPWHMDWPSLKTKSLKESAVSCLSCANPPSNQNNTYLHLPIHASSQ